MRSAEDTSRAVFAAAIAAGPADAPRAVSERLTAISSGVKLSDSDDVEALEMALGEEFGFMMALVSAGQQPTPADSARWERALRWLIQTVQGWTWGGSSDASLARLRVLLTAFQVLDVRNAGLKDVAGSLSLKDYTGLTELLTSARIQVMGDGRRGAPLGQRLADAVNKGDLRHLQQMLDHELVSVCSDLRIATVLLWALSPRDLAGLLENTKDVLRLLMVAETLGPDTPEFAINVASTTFKFIAVGELEQAYFRKDTSRNWTQILEQLLINVAAGEHWRAWMVAFFEYPARNSLRIDALAGALARLTPKHWQDWVGSLSMSYSKRSAKPVAELLTKFEQLRAATDISLMWEAAFERWNTWDYGSTEPNFFLGAPAPCALDFPVSKYFASLSAQKRNELEQALLRDIESLETRWFKDLSELVTERNRLLSRLRLVEHGSLLAGGGTQALPGEVGPGDEYSRVRYHYHDVQAGP